MKLRIVLIISCLIISACDGMQCVGFKKVNGSYLWTTCLRSDLMPKFEKDINWTGEDISSEKYIIDYSNGFYDFGGYGIDFNHSTGTVTAYLKNVFINNAEIIGKDCSRLSINRKYNILHSGGVPPYNITISNSAIKVSLNFVEVYGLMLDNIFYNQNYMLISRDTISDYEFMHNRLKIIESRFIFGSDLNGDKQKFNLKSNNIFQREDLVVASANFGIKIENQDNAIIEGNKFVGKGIQAIYLINSKNVKIVNNQFEGFQIPVLYDANSSVIDGGGNLLLP